MGLISGWSVGWTISSSSGSIIPAALFSDPVPVPEPAPEPVSAPEPAPVPELPQTPQIANTPVLRQPDYVDYDNAPLPAAPQLPQVPQSTAAPVFRPPGYADYDNILYDSKQLNLELNLV